MGGPLRPAFAKGESFVLLFHPIAGRNPALPPGNVAAKKLPHVLQ
jgi:hypothetical protein